MSQSYYQDLKIWQRSFVLCSEIYDFTKGFPNEEKFGLVSQMRRAAVSIPSNIAEGSLRRNKNEFLHFLSIALSSAAELETQILLSGTLQYGATEKREKLKQEVNEIMKMISVFMKNLKSSKS